MANGLPSSRRRIGTMTAAERRWMLAIFDTMLPVAQIGLSPSPREVALERFLEDFVRRAPVEVALGLRVALWLVMLAPPFVLGRMRTFVGLSDAERLAVLERLAASRTYVLRELPLLLKMVGCLGYCGVPQVQAGLGIPPGASPPPAWMTAPEEEHPQAHAPLDTRPAPPSSPPRTGGMPAARP